MTAHQQVPDSATMVNVQPPYPTGRKASEDLRGKQLRSNLLNKLGITGTPPKMMTVSAVDRCHREPSRGSLLGRVQILHEPLKDPYFDSPKNNAASSGSNGNSLFFVLASIFANNHKVVDFSSSSAPSLDECSDTTSRYSSCRSLEEASIGSENQQQQQHRGVTFNEDVAVIPIPRREDYSQRIRQHLWYDVNALQAMVHRNTLEFAAEGYDPTKVLLEEDHIVCPTTGELVHPIHFEIAKILRQERGKERATMSQQEAANFVTLLRNTMERLARLPIPTIAAVEGVAVGGGLEIALAADLRIASQTATFGLPETSLAIIPGAGGTQRLPRLIGAARAKELIWTGRRINAQEAYEYGLVQHVVHPGEALDKAMEISWKIATNGPVAIRASKEAIDKGLATLDMLDALEIERQNYRRVLPTSDRLEGLAAFKEGRTPQYKGE